MKTTTNYFGLLFFFIIGFLLPNKTGAQYIIKTRPLTWVFAQNPNVTVEKFIQPQFTVSLELTYKNQVWAQSGENGDFGQFYTSSGFSAAIQPRFYLESNKPLNSGFFVMGNFRTSHFRINSIDEHQWKMIARTVSRKETGNEMGFYLGRQFLFHQFTSDLAFGFGYYWFRRKETVLVQYNNPDYTPLIAGYNMKLYLNWTIGYLIGARNKPIQPVVE